MRTRHLTHVSVACAALGLLSVAGCSSNPNKKVQSAESQLTNEQQKAQNQLAELERRQAEERTSHQTDDLTQRAELQQKQAAERAEASAEAQRKIAEGQTDVTKARADFEKERRDFEATVNERLQKAAAKERQVDAKTAPKAKTTKFEDFVVDQQRYFQARDEARAAAAELRSASADSWPAQKKDVEQKLDTMESALKKLQSDV